MDSFALSRNFWNFCFDNPEKVNPSHPAIYFFAIEHCNRLGGKEKFGFPTQMTMDAIGVKKHGTYIKYFNDLVEWGFFKLVQKSTNQYSANIISLVFAIPKKGKALDKAFINHAEKQTESKGQSTGQSKGSIVKQVNNITNKPINKETIPVPVYEDFENYVFEKLGEPEFEKIKIAMKLKYQSWIENDWCDGFGTKIKNWKSKILSTIPYLKKENNGNTGNQNYIGQTKLSVREKRELEERDIVAFANSAIDPKPGEN